MQTFAVESIKNPTLANCTSAFIISFLFGFELMMDTQSNCVDVSCKLGTVQMAILFLDFEIAFISCDQV